MAHGAVQKHDFRISERPRDELGEVFDAHNLMLRRVGQRMLADRLRAEEHARFLARHDTLAGLQARQFAARLVAPRIAVNLSAEQFRDRELPQRVARILQACATDPALIELEITEPAATADAASAIKTLSALRKLGVELSIDDFGTGYSPLSHRGGVRCEAGAARVTIDPDFVCGRRTDP